MEKMELSTSDQSGVFNETPTPELFARFAAAGNWLRFIGCFGFVMALCLLLRGMFIRFGQPFPWILGSLVTAYVSAQLFLAGAKAAAAKRNNDLQSLSASGRHLLNAVRLIGIGGILLLAFISAFLPWLMFFGGFSR